MSEPTKLEISSVTRTYAMSSNTSTCSREPLDNPLERRLLRAQLTRLARDCRRQKLDAATDIIERALGLFSADVPVNEEVRNEILFCLDSLFWNLT